MENKKAGSVLKGITAVATGVAIGFIAGIFLAPKSGKETREEIKEKSLEFKENAGEKLNEIAINGKALIQKGADTLHIRRSNNSDDLPIMRNDDLIGTTDEELFTISPQPIIQEKTSTEKLLERIQGVTEDTVGE